MPIQEILTLVEGTPQIVALKPGDVAKYPLTAGITAFAGGGQGSAVELVSSYNMISVCATAGDSIKLPALESVDITIFNNGAAALDVFPNSGGNIEGGATDAAVNVAVGGTVTFFSFTATIWRQV